MDNKKRSPSDRLLFATFLKGRISSRDVWKKSRPLTVCWRWQKSLPQNTNKIP